MSNILSIETTHEIGIGGGKSSARFIRDSLASAATSTSTSSSSAALLADAGSM
jgi:hypothetical protein